MKAYKAFVIILALLTLNACGSSKSEPNEWSAADGSETPQVNSLSDLTVCGQPHPGDFVYVVVERAMYYCENDEWKKF